LGLGPGPGPGPCKVYVFVYIYIYIYGSVRLTSVLFLFPKIKSLGGQKN
jgi:hypothetical protein